MFKLDKSSLWYVKNQLKISLKIKRALDSNQLQ